MTDMGPGGEGSEGRDVTLQELERSLAARGYDTDVEVTARGWLRCTACGVASPAERWRVDEASHGTSLGTTGAEGVAFALRCPECGAGARFLAGTTAEAGEPASTLVATLEGGAAR